MRWLQLWSYYEDELEQLKTNVILIVNGTDEDIVYETMKNLRLDFPVIFDKDLFIRRNNLALLYPYTAFVVNRKKEVVWQGLPIESEDTWKSFCKTIRRKSFFNW